ncbi:hypothetical protein B296_00043233 [Ensete ventricosum]|uniref:Uncharacterized protein n=1 Tax=Ensete ventricosum TaxID=4639 RepID=A0A426Z5H1_ENSVE|nr:hypothetical protein B296_00043233 [Ensete ventricosum]
MLDKSSIVRCHGHCSLVGCCVCPDMSFIVICHGSRGIVRRSTVASALIRRLLPADMGQGHWSRVGLAHWLYCVVRCQRGQLVGHRTAKGYSEVGSSARRKPDVIEVGTRCSLPHWTNHY